MEPLYNSKDIKELIYEHYAKYYPIFVKRHTEVYLSHGRDFLEAVLYVVRNNKKSETVITEIFVTVYPNNIHMIDNYNLDGTYEEFKSEINGLRKLSVHKYDIKKDTYK